MNVMQARGQALKAKSNIGRLTRLLGEARKDLKGSQDIRFLSRQLKANQYDLKRLYGLFPEIKPIAVRQLNLFSKSRQVEEQKVIRANKGWNFVGGLHGDGKSFSFPVYQEELPEYRPEQDPADQFLMSVLEVHSETSTL